MSKKVLIDKEGLIMYHDGIMKEYIKPLQDIVGTSNDGYDVRQEVKNVNDRVDKVDSQLKHIENEVYNNVQLINNTMSQEQIQNILNQGGFIKFLKGDYYFDLIKSNCLVVTSNSNIIFENGVIINLNSTNQESYNILNLKDVENVTIQGFATIVGDRYTHQGTTGEWGMGIGIRGCNNIKIKDVTIKNCWGDGIYIGVTSNQGYSSNIITENVTCDNNRRQGLSIISVKGYLSRNDKMINTNGTAPQAGVDIEPNNSTDYLENITFENLYTAGNKSAGLMFYLSNLGTSSDNHDVSVTVINHVDNGSDVGCSIMAIGTNTVRGEIRVIKPLYKNNGTNGLLFRNYHHIFPKVYVENPMIIDCNRRGLVSDVYANAVNIYRESTDDGNNAMGNLCITNLIIDIDPNEIRGSMYIFDRITDGTGVVDVEILNPIKIVRGTRGQAWLPSEGVRINDTNNVFTRTVKSSATFTTYSYATHINNEGATKLVTYTLSALYPLNEEITFTNMTSYGFALTLTDATFIGFNNTGTNTLKVTDIYGSITLKRISETEWAIINKNC